jgi:hypothetical protein
MTSLSSTLASVTREAAVTAMREYFAPLVGFFGSLNRFIGRRKTRVRVLSQFLTLAPYGNHLSDSVVRTWRGFATLNIAAIAVCDAMAWAYLAYSTTPRGSSYLAATIVGTLVLCLIVTLDISMVTHDTTKRTSGHGHPRWWMAVAIRVAFVVLSFSITAPFITQIFFSRDVRAFAERFAAEARETARAKIAHRYDVLLEANRGKASQLAAALSKELAGHGASSQFGSGPVAASLRRELAWAESEITRVELARDRELNAFDLGSSATLSQHYGSQIDSRSATARILALSELQKSKQFISASRSIRLFIAFLFLGLLVLTAFKPEQVRVYYSEEVQAAYEQYIAGLFGEMAFAAPREMTPVRFALWYRTQSLLQASKEISNAIEKIIDQLQQQVSSQNDDLAAGSMKQQLAEARRTLSTLRAKIEHA